MQVSGADIFVLPREDADAPRAGTRRSGRGRAKHARMASARANHPSQGRRMYLVEDDELETNRISLRRAFEDLAGRHAVPEDQEWVTG